MPGKSPPGFWVPQNALVQSARGRTISLNFFRPRAPFFCSSYTSTHRFPRGRAQITHIFDRVKCRFSNHHPKIFGLELTTPCLGSLWRPSRRPGGCPKMRWYSRLGAGPFPSDFFGRALYHMKFLVSKYTLPRVPFGGLRAVPAGCPKMRWYSRLGAGPFP